MKFSTLSTLSHGDHTCLAVSLFKPRMLEQAKIVAFQQLKPIVLPNPAHSTPHYAPEELPPDNS